MLKGLEMGIILAIFRIAEVYMGEKYMTYFVRFLAFAICLFVIMGLIYAGDLLINQLVH